MAIKITAEQRKALKSVRSINWRTRLAEFLAKGPATAVEAYDATRPENKGIADTKKKHNIASQLTYLGDDGYLWIKADDKIVLIADPQNNVYPAGEKYLPKS